MEKTKKAGDAKVDKKAPKTITTRRKEKRNKKNVEQFLRFSSNRQEIQKNNFGGKKFNFVQENIFLERRYSRKYIFNEKHKREIIKQLSENNWRRTFIKTERDYHKRSSAQILTFSFAKKSVEKDVFQRFFF